MKYLTIAPSPALRPFVRFFWVLEYDTPQGGDYVYRSLADGGAELIFHYKGRFEELTEGGNIRQDYSMIHAQSKIFRRFITCERFGIFGAYLYPYALPLLFRSSSCGFSSQMIDLKDLAGAEGRELEEQMMLAPGNAHRVTILTRFLEKRLCSFTHEPPVFSAIRQVIASMGEERVDGLAEKVNLSRRQFERKFKEYSGFSPKLYSRIARFQAAIRQYRNNTRSLTEIALECGYYDQSHFIHDFKSFSGYHPRQYFFGEAEGREYMEA